MRHHILPLLLVACAGACSHNTRPSETATESRGTPDSQAKRENRDESYLYGSGDSVLEEERTSEMTPPQHRTRDEMATAGDKLPDKTRPTGPATAPATSEGEVPVGADVATKSPDNTGVNERDRDETTLTPMDQSEKEADIQITQEIRRALVDNDALSFSAKNVKIITRDGKVTLRGTVPTARERSLIEEAAKARAGVSSVDNQLELSNK